MQNPFRDYIARLHTLALQPNAPVSEVIFNELACQLFNFQFDHIPPYRRFCLARGLTPERLREWRHVPAVPTTAFKDGSWTSLPPAQRTHVFQSSGTTRQQPSLHHHSAQSLAIYERSLLLWFNLHILPSTLPNPFFLALTPSPELAPHSSLVHMLDAIRRDRGNGDFAFAGQRDKADAWTLDLEGLTLRLDQYAKTSRPVALLGTAFAFVSVLDYLAGRGIKLTLPPQSRVMETGGFKGRSRILSKAELHQLIGHRLGIPSSHIVSEYGMTELSSQAYDHVVGQPEDRSSRVFRFPPWARAICMSPETGLEVDEGQTGLIRVVDLANVRSIMAIQSEDLGVRRHDRFELIGRAHLAEPRGCSLLQMTQ